MSAADSLLSNDSPDLLTMMDRIKVPELPPGTRLLLKVPTPDDLLDFVNTHIHNHRVFGTFTQALHYTASQHPSGLPLPDVANLPSLHIDLPLPRTTDLYGYEHPPSPATQLRLLEEEEARIESAPFGELLPGETEEQWQERFGFSQLTPASFQVLEASRKFKEEKEAEEEALRQAELQHQAQEDAHQQKETSTLDQSLDFFFNQTHETEETYQQGPQQEQAQQAQSSDDPLNIVDFFNPSFYGFSQPAPSFDFDQSFEQDQSLSAPQHSSSLAAAVQAAQQQQYQHQSALGSSGSSAPSFPFVAGHPGPPPPGPPPLPPTTSVPAQEVILDYADPSQDDDAAQQQEWQQQQESSERSIGGNLAAALAIATAAAAAVAGGDSSGPRAAPAEYEGDLSNHTAAGPAAADPYDDYAPLSPSLTEEPLPPAVLPEDYDLGEDGFEMLDGPAEPVGADSSAKQQGKDREAADATAADSASTRHSRRGVAEEAGAKAPWRVEDVTRRFIAPQRDIVDEYYASRTSQQGQRPSGLSPALGAQSPKKHTRPGMERRRQDSDEMEVKQLLLGAADDEDQDTDDADDDDDDDAVSSTHSSELDLLPELQTMPEPGRPPEQPLDRLRAREEALAWKTRQAERERAREREYEERKERERESYRRERAEREREWDRGKDVGSMMRERARERERYREQPDRRERDYDRADRERGGRDRDRRSSGGDRRRGDEDRARDRRRHSDPRDRDCERDRDRDRGREPDLWPRQLPPRPTSSNAAAVAGVGDRSRAPLPARKGGAPSGSCSTTASRPPPRASTLRAGEPEYYDRDGAAATAPHRRGSPTTELFRAGLFGGKGVSHDEGHDYHSDGWEEEDEGEGEATYLGAATALRPTGHSRSSSRSRSPVTRRTASMGRASGRVASAGTGMNKSSSTSTSPTTTLRHAASYEDIAGPAPLDDRRRKGGSGPGVSSSSSSALSRPGSGARVGGRAGIGPMARGGGSGPSFSRGGAGGTRGGGGGGGFGSGSSVRRGRIGAGSGRRF